MSRRGVQVVGVLVLSSVVGAALAVAVQAVGLNRQRRAQQGGDKSAAVVNWLERHVLVDFGSQLVEAPSEFTRRIRLRNPFRHGLHLVCKSRLPCCVKVKAPDFIEDGSDAEVEVRVLLGPGTKLDLPVEVIGLGPKGIRWHLRVTARAYPKAIVHAPEALVSVGTKPVRGTVSCERYGRSPNAVDVALKAQITEPCEVIGTRAGDVLRVADDLWCRRWEVDVQFTPGGSAAQGVATLGLTWSDGVRLTRVVGWRAVPVVSATPSVVLLLGSKRSKTVLVTSHDGRPFQLRVADEASAGALKCEIEPGEKRRHFVRVHAPPGVSGRFRVNLRTNHPVQPQVRIGVVVQGG